MFCCNSAKIQPRWRETFTRAFNRCNEIVAYTLERNYWFETGEIHFTWYIFAQLIPLILSIVFRSISLLTQKSARLLACQRSKCSVNRNYRIHKPKRLAIKNVDFKRIMYSGCELRFLFIKSFACDCRCSIDYCLLKCVELSFRLPKCRWYW